MQSEYHEEVIDKEYDSRLMRRLLQYLRPYWRFFVLSVSLLLVATVLRLLRPYLYKVAIDSHIATGDVDGLKRLVLLFIVLMFSELGFRYIQIYSTRYVGQRILYDLRTQIFSHLQKMSLSFFDKNPVGRLMTRVVSDVETLNETLSVGVVNIFGDVVILLGIVIFMFALNWRLALVTLSVLPILAIATAVFRTKARESYRQIRKKVARINAYLQEHISGLKEVQLFIRESKAMERFRELNASLRDQWHKTILYYALFFPIVGLLESIAIMLILWYGGLQTMKGVEIGLVLSFIFYSQMFFHPIRDISEKYNILLAAMVSAERIFNLLDTPEAVPNHAQPVNLEQSRGDVEFRNVWFAYEPGEYVLRDVSFRVEPGERLAIVGATGAGKTSIINLLSRFYDVDRGKILVDGRDIRSYDKHSLRQHIAVVLQDVFLFSGSVEENVRIGREDIAFESIQDAAEHVNASHFIETLPDGYDEKVGERGGKLSLGQRQLLAFVRALVHEPAILVLDEATSSVDTATELLIQDAIAKLMDGRTSLTIAHRLSTVQRSDRIIVIHKGKIREEGSHQQLLAKRGLYWRLYQLQYKDQLVVPPK